MPLPISERIAQTMIIIRIPPQPMPFFLYLRLDLLMESPPDAGGICKGTDGFPALIYPGEQ